MKRLYAGFDLCDPNTSVSMTINGPAPIDPRDVPERGDRPAGGPFPRGEGARARAPPSTQELVARTARSTVRGTVQADILKEDQAQNTCIFSHGVRAAADGRHPGVVHRDTRSATTTPSRSAATTSPRRARTRSRSSRSRSRTASRYVEYYLARGMTIDDFAPNLSFFFSNGLDPEYTVIGRVARRIWAVAMRERYGANERSQKLKYHVQTSGRSLHAQEIQFNDIRTTLQALLALQDQLQLAPHERLRRGDHDADRGERAPRDGDPARSTRRSSAGSRTRTRSRAPSSSSELTDAVEEAVLDEFQRLDERGGVLGAMETQYQRAPHPGGEPPLRAQEARRRAADRRRQHVPPRRRRRDVADARRELSARDARGEAAPARPLRDFQARTPPRRPRRSSA